MGEFAGGAWPPTSRGDDGFGSAAGGFGGFGDSGFGGDGFGDVKKKKKKDKKSREPQPGSNEAPAYGFGDSGFGQPDSGQSPIASGFGQTGFGDQNGFGGPSGFDGDPGNKTGETNRHDAHEKHHHHHGDHGDHHHSRSHHHGDNGDHHRHHHHSDRNDQPRHHQQDEHQSDRHQHHRHRGEHTHHGEHKHSHHHHAHADHNEQQHSHPHRDDRHIHWEHDLEKPAHSPTSSSQFRHHEGGKCASCGSSVPQLRTYDSRSYLEPRSSVPRVQEASYELSRQGPPRADNLRWADTVERVDARRRDALLEVGRRRYDQGNNHFPYVGSRPRSPVATRPSWNPLAGIKPHWASGGRENSHPSYSNEPPLPVESAPPLAGRIEPATSSAIFSKARSLWLCQTNDWMQSPLPLHSNQRFARSASPPPRFSVYPGESRPLMVENLDASYRDGCSLSLSAMHADSWGGLEARLHTMVQANPRLNSNPYLANTSRFSDGRLPVSMPSMLSAW